jgi:uncharacterized membrane protein YcaP (DUF421 family)
LPLSPAIGRAKSYGAKIVVVTFILPSALRAILLLFSKQALRDNSIANVIIAVIDFFTNNLRENKYNFDFLLLRRREKFLQQLKRVFNAIWESV